MIRGVPPSQLIAITCAATCTVFCCTGCERPAPAAEAAQATATAAADESLPTVPVLSPEQTTIERTTTQPATVHAYYLANIFSKASGYLEELKVDIGDSVKAGEVLATISMPEVEKQFAQQQRVIERLQAEEKVSLAGAELAAANVTAAKALLEQSESEIQKTQAQLTATQSELDRTQDLVDRQAVAPRLLDEVRQRYESAVASKAAAEAAQRSAAANVAVAEAERAAAEAQVAAAQAQTAVARAESEELQVLLSYGTLVAPFDGIIVARDIDPGDLVRNAQASSGAAGPALFSIARLDKVRVRVALPENDAAQADPGDAVVLHFRSQGSRKFEGTITRLSNQLEMSTQTMLVEIELPNPNGDLKPGMYGEATIALERVEDALVLPASAVRFSDTGEAYVYTVSPSNVVAIVNVTTGFDDGREIVITEGLSPGDRVAGEMIGRLEPGQKIRPAE